MTILFCSSNEDLVRIQNFIRYLTLVNVRNEHFLGV
jgi:hypothetical protein